MSEREKAFIVASIEIEKEAQDKARRQAQRKYRKQYEPDWLYKLKKKIKGYKGQSKGCPLLIENKVDVKTKGRFCCLDAKSKI